MCDLLCLASFMSIVFSRFIYVVVCITKESACNAGDLDLIPGSGRPPGEGNGYPFQCSYLKNSMDRGPWQAVVEVAKSQT